MPENYVQNLNEFAARLRVLESKVNLIKDDISVTNSNLIEDSRKAITKHQISSQDIKEMRIEITKMKETLKHMIEESSEFARKQDIKVLEKYINMWNPLRYVTETEVKDITKKQLKELLELQSETENAD